MVNLVGTLTMPVTKIVNHMGHQCNLTFLSHLILTHCFSMTPTHSLLHSLIILLWSHFRPSAPMKREKTEGEQNDDNENPDEGSISDLSTLCTSNLTPFRTIAWTRLFMGHPQATFLSLLTLGQPFPFP